MLDIIAHRIRGSKGSSVKGRVFFNGKREKGRARRKLLSYVAQEDTLLGVFTVSETLWFAARFFYGYNVDTTLLQEKIDAIIDSVGLRDCKDTIVGNIFFKGLSGGQVRRLSIAVELISSPAILLLDEPTSGLDSASAFAIMQELRGLADLGHTVLCTIHQPSSEIWARFDSFMLIAQGKVCYMGPAARAVPFFGSIGYVCPQQFNPADFVIGMVATDFEVNLFKRPSSIQELADAFDKSALARTAEARVALGARVLPANETLINESKETTELALEGDNGNAAYASAISAKSTDYSVDDADESETLYRRCCVAGNGRAGFFSNLCTLVHRNLLNMVRNPGIILVREVMYLMLALVLGLVFLYVGRTYTPQSVNSRNSILFFVGAFFVFMSVAVLPFIIEERAVFLREKRNGAYTAAPYVVAQFITLLPGTFLIASTTSLLIVFMVSLNGFGYYLLCLWLSLVVAECFVHLVGSLSPHYIIGIAVAAGVFGICMVFEGFFIVFYDIQWYLRWIGYIDPHRYSFRAFMRNEYSTINTTELNGQTILDFYGFNDSDVIIKTIGGDLGVLVGFALAYILLFYLVCEFYWR